MRRLMFSILVAMIASISSMDIMAKTTAVKHVFGVHGLSCPFCAVGIQKTFKKIKGVQSTDVSLKNNTVTLKTNKGICFTDSELKKLLGKTGFTFHGIIEQPDSCKK